MESEEKRPTPGRHAKAYKVAPDLRLFLSNEYKELRERERERIGIVAGSIKASGKRLGGVGEDYGDWLTEWAEEE